MSELKHDLVADMAHNVKALTDFANAVKEHQAAGQTWVARDLKEVLPLALAAAALGASAAALVADIARQVATSKNPSAATKVQQGVNNRAAQMLALASCEARGEVVSFDSALVCVFETVRARLRCTCLS